MFPVVTVGGTQKYLQLRPNELIEYESQVEKVLERYIKRLQWLLSGKHHSFIPTQQTIDSPLSAHNAKITY